MELAQQAKICQQACAGASRDHPQQFRGAAAGPENPAGREPRESTIPTA